MTSQPARVAPYMVESMRWLAPRDWIVTAAVVLAACDGGDGQVEVDAAAAPIDAAPQPTGLPPHLRITATSVGCIPARPEANVIELVGADLVPRLVLSTGEVPCSVDGQWSIGCTDESGSLNWSLLFGLNSDLSGGSGHYVSWYDGAETMNCGGSFTITSVETL
jgi:hypothetical protein